MKFLSENQMRDLKDIQLTCRQSIWGPIGLTIIFITIPATIKTFVDDSTIFHISIAASIVMSILAWRIAKAAVFPSNWVLKADEQGLYLKIRSYLNFQLDPDDKVIVYIPFDEIHGAEEITEHHQTKSFFGLTKTESRMHLNLILKTNAAEKIIPLIHEEVYRQPPEHNKLVERVNHLHVQIQVPAPDMVQVPWADRNTRINPDLKVVFNLLSSQGIQVNVDEESEGGVHPGDDLFSESA